MTDVPRILGLGASLTLLSWLAGTNQDTAHAQSPPATRTVEVVETLHGVEVADPYRWLEAETDPEVVAWIDAQRAYTASALGAFPQRQVLAKRFRRLYETTKISSPGVFGKRYLFTKHEGLKNHAVLYVRQGSHTASANPILDPNTWSADGTVALDWYYPTPDASLIAYGKSASGDEKSTLYVLDVATGKHLPDTIPYTRYTSLTWDPDRKGFIYSRYPEPGTVDAGDENYHRKLYHHRLGDDWRSDALVLGDLSQKEEFLDISASSDHQYELLSRSVGWAKNDLFFRKAGSKGPFGTIISGRDSLSSADVHRGQLFIRTNLDAPRYRIAKASLDQPDPAHWTDLIPQQGGVIKEFAVIGRRLFVHLSQDVTSRLLIYDLDGKKLRQIELPTLGTLTGGAGGVFSGEPDGDEAFFSFESFAYPPANFRYVISTDTLEKLEQQETDLDLGSYVTRQVWYESKDGTRVPMFVVHKKGLRMDGDNPTVLYGYGGFNISLTPRFDVRKIPWLDAGGVYAVANLRGGGEFGKTWHESGRRGRKQNVFDDFIYAAQKLIDLKYTNKQRLGIMGGSNGGLLMGACLTQRPDLFRAVVCAVPLLDMVRYHHFQIARLWIPEYGSADDAEQFKWLYAYSPYHHVKPGTSYPATLMMTAESDSRVQPMHAYKMTAALQAANKGGRPILLRAEKKAGHGVGKPLSMRIDEQVDI
ncbi:MAG: prolyl oligopeptidase family protein, partial [Phycisphaerae bacterium]